jgi:large subunit ribosomal protein L28
MIGCFLPLIPDTIMGWTYIAKRRGFMSRRCQLTGKKANNAYAVSHSHRRTKKLQQVNLQWKRVWWAEGNRWVRLHLSTKAIKTLTTKGLQVMANEAGINLNKL